MVSGPVPCQIVTRLAREGSGGLWEQMVQILIISASITLQPHKQCSAVWCTIRRTLSTFQLPFYCSEGSQMRCVQSFRMSGKGKAFACYNASKISPRVSEGSSCSLVCPDALPYPVKFSHQVLRGALVLPRPPRAMRMRSGLTSLPAQTVRGQFARAQEMTSETLVPNPSSTTCLPVWGKSL